MLTYNCKLTQVNLLYSVNINKGLVVMEKKEYYTIPELAKLMGLSRVAVYKKVKKGEIKAKKIGGIYLISKNFVASILGKNLNQKQKKEIEEAVKRTVKEYSEVLKLLGRE